MSGAGIIVLFLYIQVFAATILAMEAGILLATGFGAFGGFKITAKDWRALAVWIGFMLLVVAVGCDWLVLKSGRAGRVVLSDEYCAALEFSSVLGLVTSLPGREKSAKIVLIILAGGLIAMEPILRSFSTLLRER
jgi:hypothetical protein